MCMPDKANLPDTKITNPEKCRGWVQIVVLLDVPRKRGVHLEQGRGEGLYACVGSGVGGGVCMCVRGT